MKEEYLDEYARYFGVGLRVEIGIPLASGEVFREWGDIVTFDRDALSVLLSRDRLPKRVRIEYGDILDVGVWLKQDVYSCKGIVIERGDGKSLRLTLIGPVTLKEKRQFYRVNTKLRFRYALSPGGSEGGVKQAWQERKEQESLNAVEEGADFPRALLHRKAPKPVRAELVWHDLFEQWASISGGGMGFKLPCKLSRDDFIHLELYLPFTPVRIVHAVAQVVYVLDPFIGIVGSDSYYTGMHFVFLDDRDRDHIIEYISKVELARLRERSEKLYDEGEEGDPEPLALRFNVRRLAVRSTIAALFLFACYVVVRNLISYYARGDNTNEIRQTYQEQLRKWRNR